jgi:hypothetical protein
MSTAISRLLEDNGEGPNDHHPRDNQRQRLSIKTRSAANLSIERLMWKFSCRLTVRCSIWLAPKFKIGNVPAIMGIHPLHTTGCCNFEIADIVIDSTIGIIGS